MASHTNPICAVCPTAFNGLNGRYCSRLQRYVEHTTIPVCNTNNSK